MRFPLKYLSIIFRIAVSVGTIWYLAKTVDVETLLRDLNRLDVGWAVLAVAVIALQPALGALRWGILLAALRSPLSIVLLIRTIYISLFFNQVLPASVGGDVIRIVLAKRAGCPLRDALASTMLDRVFMMLLLIAMFGVSAGAFSGGPAIPDAYINFVLGLTGVICAALLAISLDLAPVWRLPLPLADRLEGPVLQTRAILRAPFTLAATVVVSLASHLNLIVATYLFLVALGAQLAFAQVLLLMPLVLLAAVLPISFGGWGIREAAMITVFAQTGIPEEISLSASLLIGVASILITMPGLWFFSRTNIQLQKHVDAP